VRITDGQTAITPLLPVAITPHF